MALGRIVSVDVEKLIIQNYELRYSRDRSYGKGQENKMFLVFGGAVKKNKLDSPLVVVGLKRDIVIIIISQVVPILIFCVQKNLHDSPKVGQHGVIETVSF